MSVNRVILVGNLGQNPELKSLPGGGSVCNFSVATHEKWTDKSGAKQERVEWHRVNVFGAVAENCAKYLQKGRQVYLEGSIHTRKWQDKEGKDRYSTEVTAQNVQFLGGAAAAPGDRTVATTARPDAPVIDESDIPF